MSSDADKEAAGAQSEAAARKADEGARSGTRIPSAKALRHHWPTLLRLFELILAIFCVGLIVDPVNKARFPQNNMHHVAVIYTAFAGYTIITGVIVLGQLCGERLGWRMSIAFSLIGAIVFTAAGGVIISDWTKYMYNHIFHPSKQYMDMMCSAGVFAIFGAIVFIVDAILTFRSDADM